MISLVALVVVLILLVESFRPAVERRSSFEVARLERLGGLSDKDILRRRHLDSILSLRHIIVTVLLVSLVPLAIAGLGWAWGTVLGVVVALQYQKLANTKLVAQLGAKVYGLIEPGLLSFCEKFSSPLRLFRVSERRSSEDRLTISSKEELVDTLKRPPSSLSSFELSLLKSALKFEERSVEDVMTPRSVVKSISHDEMLGPILLNELHQTGHSRFPVVAGDIDHVVGVLYVRDLLTIDGSKNSNKVSQVMDEEVCFIREDQSLAHALKAFTKTEKLMFIVVNKYRETVGVLTLEDVIESLIGQKINDEFEQHTDLRAVAEKGAASNNSPAGARNL